jgi:predicted transcriptional regulator
MAKRVWIRAECDEDLKRRVDEAARRERRSMRLFVLNVLDEYLRNSKRKVKR